MYKFSKRSEGNLKHLDTRLEKICREAIKLMNFSVIEGYRNEERQNHLHDIGFSKLKYPHSKHNSMPSRAVDIVPFPVDWNDRERFQHLAGIMFGIAHGMGVKLRFGGDWDGDKSFTDQTFHDLAHFELI